MTRASINMLHEEWERVCNMHRFREFVPDLTRLLMQRTFYFGASCILKRFSELGRELQTDITKLPRVQIEIDMLAEELDEFAESLKKGRA